MTETFSEVPEDLEQLLNGFQPVDENEPQNSPAFVLLHGSWMRGKHWDPVSAELNSLGYPVLAPDLPLDKEGMDARRLGRYIGDLVLELGDDDVALVAHSRSGNGALWAALYQPVSMIYFVCASFENPTLRFMKRRGDAALPKRNPNPEFAQAIGKNSDNPQMTFIKSGYAARILFNRVKNANDRQTAEEDLRETRRISEEPRLRKFPDYTPYVYYYAEYDNCIGLEWTKAVCRERLRIRPRKIAGADHCPMISQPARLTNMLVDDSSKRRIPV
jgi:pimeloyl-ACP methyl ester carboxylesterase